MSRQQLSTILLPSAGPYILSGHSSMMVPEPWVEEFDLDPSTAEQSQSLILSSFTLMSLH